MEGTHKRPVTISVHPNGLTPARSASGSVHLRERTAENKAQFPAAAAAAAPAEQAAVPASKSSIDSKGPAAPSLLRRLAAKAANSKTRNGGATDSNVDSKADNLAALYQARADLEEALGWCEDRLASMEEELLQRSPNTSTPRRVNPTERIFSRSSHTSAFWRSPRSRRKRYRHGIDSPPLGYYAKDSTTARARSGSTDDEHTVIAYDAFRRRWVPVPKSQLERAALEKVAAATAATANPRSAKRLPGRA